MRIKSFTAKSAVLTDLTFNPISETMYAYSRTNEILVRPPADNKVVLNGKLEIPSITHIEREALTTIHCSSLTCSPHTQGSIQSLLKWFYESRLDACNVGIRRKGISC